MVESNLLISLLMIALVSKFGLGKTSESTMIELYNLFKEIGFSPACVSQTLAQCENSASDSLMHEMKVQLHSMRNSMDKFKELQNKPRNCADLLKIGDNESGVRRVYPFSFYENRPVSVFCDQTTDGGGWTVIQHREGLPQRENFFRKWVEYKLGFGKLEGEFWLGLANIHALVRNTLMELRVDLEDFDGKKRWAKYEHFCIEDATHKYLLDLGEYSGNAGDSLKSLNGQKFTTKDQDNDTHLKNCAEEFRGAWWYAACHGSNLNGYQYEGNHTSYADGINWYEFHGYHYSLKTTSLSIRPKFKY